jgi:hypothetical protein
MAAFEKSVNVQHARPVSSRDNLPPNMRRPRALHKNLYDNMKTAVETIFAGKDRQYNRRFLQMCSHHLVEPVACTPASGWEKGEAREPGRARARAFRLGGRARLEALRERREQDTSETEA